MRAGRQAGRRRWWQHTRRAGACGVHVHASVARPCDSPSRPRTCVVKHAQARPRAGDQQAAALGRRQHVRPVLLHAQLQRGRTRRLPALHGHQPSAERPPVLHELRQGRGRMAQGFSRPAAHAACCGGRPCRACAPTAAPRRVGPRPATPTRTTGGICRSGLKLSSSSAGHCRCWSPLLLAPAPSVGSLLLLLLKLGPFHCHCAWCKGRVGGCARRAVGWGRAGGRARTPCTSEQAADSPHRRRPPVAAGGLQAGNRPAQGGVRAPRRRRRRAAPLTSAGVSRSSGPISARHTIAGRLLGTSAGLQGGRGGKGGYMWCGGGESAATRAGMRSRYKHGERGRGAGGRAQRFGIWAPACRPLPPPHPLRPQAGCAAADTVQHRLRVASMLAGSLGRVGCRGEGACERQRAGGRCLAVGCVTAGRCVLLGVPGRPVMRVD